MEINSIFSRRVLLTVALLLALAGCTTAGRPAPTKPSTGNAGIAKKTNAAWAPSKGAEQAQAKKPASDAVAPGFLVAISNAQDEKLRGKFRIDPDGSLKLPYGVDVQTKGMSEQQLKQHIVKAYTNYFKGPAEMRISIEREYYVDARGLVEKAGRYIVPANASLDEVIAKAGGLIKGRDGEPVAQYVRIKQPTGTTFVRLSEYFGGNESLVPAWQGGDIVFFQSEKGQSMARNGQSGDYVHVLGQVVSPGDYHFQSGAGMLDYIVMAGGPTKDGELSRVLVVPSDQQRAQASVHSLETLATAPAVSQGDTLIVLGGARTNLERQLGITSGISAIVSSLATVALLAATL